MVDMKQLPDTEIAEQVDKAKKAENWTTDEGNGTDYRDIRRYSKILLVLTTGTFSGYNDIR